MMMTALLEHPSLETVPASVRAIIQQACSNISHSLEFSIPSRLADTLDILAQLSADEAVLLSAFLYELPELRAEIADSLTQQYPAILGLLEGQEAAAHVWVLHDGKEAGRNGEGLRRLLLAMVQDLRVVPILLARQLVLMRQAAHLEETQQRALAQLTRDIHAPLANRLGIWQLKWELEDLALRFLQPDIYRRIARGLDEKRIEREHYIENVKATLSKHLKENGIDAQISGRPKHIYSIWRKMQKKNLPLDVLDELNDLRAVRLMVQDVPMCYAALGVVHSLWTPVSSEFDDYIARPKANDYRSLHTGVIGPEGRALEVQIRTYEMHTQAELGVAAHWRYKEGKSAEKSFDRKINWMRQILEQNQEASNETTTGNESVLADALNAELTEERVYVLTPKGEVIDLPLGATPLDFAYHIHTMVGHRCQGAKVNGRIVPLNHQLQSGDRVEILTGKQAQPRRDWLLVSHGYLASGRSRDKVRAWFHKLDFARNSQAGKELLDKELKRVNLHHADLLPIAKRFNQSSVDDLYVQVALGDVGCNQIIRLLHEILRTPTTPTETTALPSPSRSAKRLSSTGKSKFTVQGVGNLLVQLARCCSPVAGEEIGGYLTQQRGVTVHRRDCTALARLATLHPHRILTVEWGQSKGGYEVNIQIFALERKHLLKDITTLIAQEDGYVMDIHGDTHNSSGKVKIQLRLRVSDYGQLSTLLNKLDALPGVDNALRVG